MPNKGRCKANKSVKNDEIKRKHQQGGHHTQRTRRQQSRRAASGHGLREVWRTRHYRTPTPRRKAHPLQRRKGHKAARNDRDEHRGQPHRQVHRPRAGSAPHASDACARRREPDNEQPRMGHEGQPRAAHRRDRTLQGGWHQDIGVRRCRP